MYNIICISNKTTTKLRFAVQNTFMAYEVQCWRYLIWAKKLLDELKIKLCYRKMRFVIILYSMTVERYIKIWSFDIAFPSDHFALILYHLYSVCFCLNAIKDDTKKQNRFDSRILERDNSDKTVKKCRTRISHVWMQTTLRPRIYFPNLIINSPKHASKPVIHQFNSMSTYVWNS